MTKQEFIERFNSLKIRQTFSVDDFVFDQIEDKDVRDFLMMSSFESCGYHVDKHRWYETDIYVYQDAGGDYFGLRMVAQNYSESSSVEDHYHHIEALDMESYTSIMFKIKK